MDAAHIFSLFMCKEAFELMVSHEVNFFFIGFPKSGSTTFYYLLKSHPEIFAPDLKELNFFNSDFILEFQKRLGENHFELINSINEYAQLFSDAGSRIRGDFTPVNVFSIDAPVNIFKYNPAAKIIISIREPVSFLRSFHFQSLYNLLEDEPDFLKALSLEELRRAGKHIPKYCHNPFYLFYSSLIEYKKYIKGYADVFGVENIRVILFDDILAHEYTIYKEILRFLGVSNLDFVPPKHDTNPSHALRFAGLRKFLFTPTVKKFLYTRTPKALLPLAGGMSQAFFKKNQEKPFVSKNDISLLKSKFKPAVKELSVFLNETNLLDRDLLVTWDY
jgi:hypothetical protein